jgi:hypothetical protein
MEIVEAEDKIKETKVDSMEIAEEKMIKDD